MSFKKIVFISFLLFVFNVQNVNAQTTLYDISTIQKIEIFFSQPDWDYQMDTAKYGAEGYTFSDSVKINSIKFDSVGVKYKGNSSFDSTRVKNPLHIELNTYKSQSYQGIKDIKLSNCYSDPSMIREVLAYKILENYMDCPRSNFAQVYINGNYIGLYSNAESINKQFLSNHFSSSNNTFIKCNPIVNPGPASKSNLKYITNDSSTYFNFYEIKSNNGWNELVKLADTVTNYPSVISSVVDIDRVLWMLAFNSVLINLDSYSGAFCQNYYLYKDATLRYNPIVWDLNMAFGGFAFVGSGASSLGTLTLTNMQQLPINIHSTDNYWPLIKNVLSDPMYKKMYVAHVKTITNDFFASNNYQSIATQLQAIIDTAVQSDVNKFYSYTQFQGGLTSDVINGGFTIPGISNLMGPRVAYLQSTADFTNTAPLITSVLSSTTNPSVGSVVTITANVTNSNTVYLGYRNSVLEKFTRIQMLDDGLHNDGAAGDNVYGASFTMNTLIAQYYIYAENNNVGMFSPEKAEHVFYTLNASLSVTSPGQVVINEFLAINQSNEVNEYFQNEDWIELYNTTSTPLDLYGLYLTDNFSNRTKYAFPSSAVIPANGYLIVWADEEPSVNQLHCNFKLSGSGEQLMLSNALGIILDSITFGAQTADKSMGRCPNGTGFFSEMAIPSYAAMNCETSISEQKQSYNVILYPNPSSNIVYLSCDKQFTNKNMSVYTTLGEKLFDQIVNSHGEPTEINFSNFSSGIYFIELDSKYYKIQVIR